MTNTDIRAAYDAAVGAVLDAHAKDMRAIVAEVRALHARTGDTQSV